MSILKDVSTVNVTMKGVKKMSNTISVDWETQKYQQFIFNPENSMNCGECPANRNADSWPGYTLPCGQQCCWVDCAVCTDDQEEYE